MLGCHLKSPATLSVRLVGCECWDFNYCCDRLPLVCARRCGGELYGYCPWFLVPVSLVRAEYGSRLVRVESAGVGACCGTRRNFVSLSSRASSIGGLRSSRCGNFRGFVWDRLALFARCGSERPGSQPSSISSQVRTIVINRCRLRTRPTHARMTRADLDESCMSLAPSRRVSLAFKKL